MVEAKEKIVLKCLKENGIKITPEGLVPFSQVDDIHELYSTKVSDALEKVVKANRKKFLQENPLPKLPGWTVEAWKPDYSGDEVMGWYKNSERGVHVGVTLYFTENQLKVHGTHWDTHSGADRVEKGIISDPEAVWDGKLKLAKNLKVLLEKLIPEVVAATNAEIKNKEEKEAQRLKIVERGFKPDASLQKTLEEIHAWDKKLLWTINHNSDVTDLMEKAFPGLVIKKAPRDGTIVIYQAEKYFYDYDGDQKWHKKS